MNGIWSKQYSRNLDRIKGLISYVPQNYCLLEKLSLENALYVFAALKGCPSYMIKRTVEKQMQLYDIARYKDTLSINLSGGNKRKLQTACAMLGHPKICLLDESSKGVDPDSRLKMWKAIKADSQSTALILTTHSMEEAEMLGSKIAIMVEGRLVCFGSSQHLKDKYGQGYDVEMSMDYDRVYELTS